MSLEATAKQMAERDFKLRFKGASYSRSDAEMRKFMDWRFKYWVNKIKEERGIKNV